MKGVLSLTQSTGAWCATPSIEKGGHTRTLSSYNHLLATNGKRHEEKQRDGSMGHQESKEVKAQQVDMARHIQQYRTLVIHQDGPRAVEQQQAGSESETVKTRDTKKCPCGCEPGTVLGCQRPASGSRRKPQGAA